MIAEPIHVTTVYTQGHVDYLAEVILAIYAERDLSSGYRIVWRAPVLQHFIARLEPIA